MNESTFYVHVECTTINSYNSLVLNSLTLWWTKLHWKGEQLLLLSITCWVSKNLFTDTAVNILVSGTYLLDPQCKQWLLVKPISPLIKTLLWSCIIAYICYQYINLIVFVLKWLRIEPTIYCICDKHANQFITAVVSPYYDHKPKVISTPYSLPPNKDS